MALFAKRILLVAVVLSRPLADWALAVAGAKEAKV
jgi:hypothetical protein